MHTTRHTPAIGDAHAPWTVRSATHSNDGILAVPATTMLTMRGSQCNDPQILMISHYATGLISSGR